MNWGFHAGIPWISQFHAFIIISFSVILLPSCQLLGVIILFLLEPYSILQEPRRLYLHWWVRSALSCLQRNSTASLRKWFKHSHRPNPLLWWPLNEKVIPGIHLALFVSSSFKTSLGSVWRKLVAVCHQQLTSMTLGPEMGWVRLSEGNSTSLSPFSHHFPWLCCHGVVAYATQNNNVILGKLCNEVLSLVHQAPYMLIAGMLTNWSLQVCHWWKTQKFTFYQTTWYTSMAWV